MLIPVFSIPDFLLNNMTRAVLILSVLVIGSCSSKKKTERELYEEMTSGFKYTTYKAASGAGIGPVVTAYNEQKPDSLAPLNSEYAHLLLGYMWTISRKPAMAFAEADLAQESDKEEVKLMAQSLRSIVMYEQGWNKLAKQESDDAKKYAQGPTSKVKYEVSVFYMVMGVAKIYDKDFNGSKVFWAGFANETQIHWPYQVTDALADFQNNKVQEGLSKLKVLSQDPNVPEALRIPLAAEITRIESKVGDVNSSLFWPKLISAVVFDELKRTGNQQMIDVITVMEKWRDKLPG